eukprot:2669863-Alexandrium_andersonii.AAC.1
MGTNLQGLTRAAKTSINVMARRAQILPIALAAATWLEVDLEHISQGPVVNLSIGAGYPAFAPMPINAPLELAARLKSRLGRLARRDATYLETFE